MWLHIHNSGLTFINALHSRVDINGSSHGTDATDVTVLTSTGEATTTNNSSV